MNRFPKRLLFLPLILIIAGFSLHLLLHLRLLPLVILRPIPLRPIDVARPNELEILDRNKAVLRHLPADDGTRSAPVDESDIPKVVVNAFLAAEDKRFFHHPGYDLVAISRAFYDNVRYGRVVSGASTITQQLVRISHPRKRNLYSKLIELVCAIKLEHLLEKQTILKHYLNRVPMGSNINGVGLAARRYFHCHVSRLDVSQAAFLAALPQSPGRITHNRKGLERRRKSIIRKMMLLGKISVDEFDEALRNPPKVYPPIHPFSATHAVQMVLRGKKGYQTKVQTTISASLQKVAERVLRSRREWLEEKRCDQAALVVLDNKTLEVLALVGSMGVRDSLGGWNNGCVAYRSAGSTLKPFAYALALEEGWTASSMLRDTSRTYATPLSDYRPLNFSRVEHGPVLLRQALGASLNLPAVNLLKDLGVEKLFVNLKSLGLKPLEDSADHYGLGLVLGNMEVRLLDLAAAYAALANGGKYKQPRLLAGSEQDERQVYTKETAYIVTHMLADPSARVLAFGTPWYLDFSWPVAMKTGTSTSYRDTWLVAYTTRHTIAAWAGNFNGSPTAKLTGAAACGPIVHDILEHLYSDSHPQQFQKPEGLQWLQVCAISGCQPGEACKHKIRELFALDRPPGRTCPVHRKEQPELVYLPAEYAPWESKRLTQGLLGRFRLQGAVPVPEAHTIGVPQQSQAVSQVVTGHVSIGASEFPVARWPEGACSIEITSPLAVDRYVIDRQRPLAEQVIRLQVEVSRPVNVVTWYIDSVRYATLPAPYETYWRLERGQHRIVAACPDGTAAAVTVTVE